MTRPILYTQGVRDRAVQMVLDQKREYDPQWQTVSYPLLDSPVE